MTEREPDLLDYFQVLWRRRWLLAVGVGGCVLGAAVATWLLPATYRVRAIVDIGDLPEGHVPEIERLVARWSSQGLGLAEETDAPTGHLKIEYKKPYRIELALDTSAPAQMLPAVETMLGGLLADVNRVGAAAEAREQLALESVRQEIAVLGARLRAGLERRVEEIRRDIEGLAGEAGLIVARLHAALAAGLDRARTDAGAVAAELERHEQELRAEERRAGELRAQLATLRRAVADLRDGGEDPGTALLAHQMAREIIEREDALARAEASLGGLPARIRALRERRQAALTRVNDLEGALALLRAPGAPERPRDLERAWATLWRSGTQGEVSLAETLWLAYQNPARLHRLRAEQRGHEAALAALRAWDGETLAEAVKVGALISRAAEPGDALLAATQRLTVELLPRLRQLQEQTRQRRFGAEAARVVLAPRVPPSPVRPRLWVNLAAGALVGLAGSVVAAFLVEHVSEARRRARG